MRRRQKRTSERHFIVYIFRWFRKCVSLCQRNLCSIRVIMPLTLSKTWLNSWFSQNLSFAKKKEFRNCQQLHEVPHDVVALNHNLGLERVCCVCREGGTSCSGYCCHLFMGLLCCPLTSKTRDVPRLFWQSQPASLFCHYKFSTAC